MKEPTWLLRDVVIAVQPMLLAEHGGKAGIRDEALLESALMRPQQQYAYGQDVTLFQLAACYGFGLARNHPFIDGNKRIALTVTGIFLEINGYSLNAPEPEAVIMLQHLAAGEIEQTAFAAWLEANAWRHNP